MFTTRLIASTKLLLVCTTALSLAACESAGSYRVASVGSVPDGGTASSGDGSGSGSGAGGTAGTGSGSGSAGGGTGGSGTGGTGTGSGGSTGSAAPVGGGLLVTAGNAVIGVAGKQSALTNLTLLPTAGKVSGVVTAVIVKTGQTLVDLGSGKSLILNGTGKLGEIVKIDLGSRSVIGASAGSSLLGIGVLSSPSASGRLAAVNVANAWPLLAVGGTSVLGGVTSVNGILTPVTAPLTGALTPSSGVTGVLTPVTSTVTSVVGGVTAPTGGPTGLVAGVGGALGVNATPGSTTVGGKLGGVLGLRSKP